MSPVIKGNPNVYSISGPLEETKVFDSRHPAMEANGGSSGRPVVGGAEPEIAWPLAASATGPSIRLPSADADRAAGVAAEREVAGSGTTVGLIGSIIGVHWSLALSALVLLTAITRLFVERPSEAG